MDINVDGKTYSVNLNLPDFKQRQQGVGGGTDFAAMIEQQKQQKAEILEKGFGKYIGDMQQEKLEKEIKEKILAALGLSEEEYNKLPATQRAAIEQAIQEAIQQEMQARTEEKQKENQGKGGISVAMVAAFSE